jgi:hypothetical protein
VAGLRGGGGGRRCQYAVEASINVIVDMLRVGAVVDIVFAVVRVVACPTRVRPFAKLVDRDVAGLASLQAVRKIGGARTVEKL